MNGTILFVMEEGKLFVNPLVITYIYIFSFYHSTSVSLGDSVIIFGGYDHHGHEEYGHQKHQNLKNIGMVVIISNRES